jgi:hypothetical protein
MIPLVYGGTIWPSLTAEIPDHHVAFPTVDEFLSWLRLEASTPPPASKADRYLISAGYSERRGAGQVLGSSGLWFDHDDKTGRTPLEQLPHLFPWRLVAVNTYSASTAALKYRLWLPADRLMTAAEYKAVWAVVYGDIKWAHKSNGFDTAPSNPASLFYLPSVAASGASYFVEHHGAALPVDSLLATAARRESLRNRPSDYVMPIKATAITMVIESLEHIPADDRNEWFRIGCALWHEFGEYGRGLWDTWSMRSTKFNRVDQEKTWRSIRSSRVERPITIATVFGRAKERRENRRRARGCQA